MALDDIKNSLNRVMDIAVEYEEEMWNEENAILGKVFRDIACEVERIISDIHTYEATKEH